MSKGEKMVTKDFYNVMHFSKTSDFAEIRRRDKKGNVNWFHSGNDWWSQALKKQDLPNLLDGVCHYKGAGRDYGNFIMLKHNPKYAGGPDELLYSYYCHLHKFEAGLTVGQFVSNGTIIGYMGNTGYCLTKGWNGKLRKVTEKEMQDPKTHRGVHLHQSFMQYAEAGQQTKLLKDMIKRIDIKPVKDYIYQWGKIFYRPETVIRYFQFLKVEKETEEKS